MFGNEMVCIETFFCDASPGAGGVTVTTISVGTFSAKSGGALTTIVGMLRIGLVCFETMGVVLAGIDEFDVDKLLEVVEKDSIRTFDGKSFDVGTFDDISPLIWIVIVISLVVDTVDAKWA